MIHVIDSVLLLPEEEPLDLVDTAISAGDFETLVAALVETELDAALRGEGPFTVSHRTMMPLWPLLSELDMTAEASGTREGLSLRHSRYRHTGRSPSRGCHLFRTVRVETLAGEMLSVDVIDGDVFINDAKVV